MYEKQSYTKILQYKYRREYLNNQCQKINLILSLNALNGLLYLKLLLKKFQMAKKLFVMDIEQGQEVFIPSDFSQKDLPINFRYYDPILHIV